MYPSLVVFSLVVFGSNCPQTYPASRRVETTTNAERLAGSTFTK
jgi:hypothetical protein